MKIKIQISSCFVKLSLSLKTHLSFWNFLIENQTIGNDKKYLFIKRFVLFNLLLCPFTLALGQSDNVKTHSEQLLEVKKSIRVKQLEKNKLILQEKIFKKELESLSKDIEQSEKKLAKYSKDIKVVQNNLEKSSKIYNSAFSKSANLDKIIVDEVKLFNKMTFRFSYDQNPIEYKIRCESLKYRKKILEKERQTTIISAMNLKKWEKSKKEILNLQLQEKKLVVENRNMFKGKNELLKTISNKRLATENTIKTLNENAKALQTLINKVTMVNRQNQATNKILQTRRKLLWPVNGKIVATFGKNKHPELDNTYTISSGIEIKAADFSQVKSVESGVVVFARPFRSYGKIIIIDHGDIVSVYGGLKDILVKEKQKVSKGTIIAKLGNGEDNVLHFGIQCNGVMDNPILWLQ